MFMTVKQASEKWGISDRRIRVLILLLTVTAELEDCL